MIEGSPIVPDALPVRTGRHHVRRVAGGLAWVTAGDLAGKGAALAFTAMAITRLPVELFGVFAALQAGALLAAAIWDLGSAQLLTREIAAGRLSAETAVWRVVRIRGLGLIPWATVLVGVAIVANVHSSDAAIAVVATFAGSAAYSIALLPLAVLRGTRRFREVSFITMGSRWLTVILGAIGVTFFSAHALVVLLAAWAIGESLVLISAALVTRSRGWFRSMEKQLGMRRSLPFSMTSILQIAYNRFDLILVAALATAGQLGAYATASRLQDALLIVPSSVATVAFTHAAQLSASDPNDPAATRRLAIRLVALSVGLSSAMALAIAILAPWIFSAVLPSYVGAVFPTQIICLSIPLIGCTAPVAAIVAARGRPGIVTIAVAVAFGVVVISDVLLVPGFQAVGAATAATVRELGVVLVLFLGARRVGLLPSRLAAQPQAV